MQNDRDKSPLESFLERAGAVLERGVEELLREARVGKTKVVDIYQLRRERGRLLIRLGERALEELDGETAKPSAATKQLISKIRDLESRIRAKEVEVDDLRNTGGTERSRSTHAKGKRKPKPAADED